MFRHVDHVKKSQRSQVHPASTDTIVMNEPFRFRATHILRKTEYEIRRGKNVGEGGAYMTGIVRKVKEAVATPRALKTKK